MESLTRAFGALSDDTRLRMVEHLRSEGEVAAGDLGALTDISGPAVSRHLKVLREAGLVECVKVGQWLHCRRDEDALREVAAALTEV